MEKDYKPSQKYTEYNNSLFLEMILKVLVLLINFVIFVKINLQNF
jgi:hypothetical protein